MNIAFYSKPSGAQFRVEIKNINPEDAAWFSERGAFLSAEKSADTFVFYADVGLKDEDGEPMEAIELANGRSCEDTLHALRVQCEEMLKDYAS